MYMSTNPSDMEPTATNFPQGLVARAERADLWGMLLISKKLDVSHNCRKLGNFEFATGLAIVKSLGL